MFKKKQKNKSLNSSSQEKLLKLIKNSKIFYSYRKIEKNNTERKMKDREKQKVTKINRHKREIKATKNEAS